ncbi:MAG: amidohydrolase [Candidatus Micrarchaeia archaeon]
MSILVKNASFILTQNPRRELLRDTDVFVDGNVIAGIGRNLRERAEFVIDGKGKLLLPGLINTHTHLAMTLMRGYADDMPLQPWLEEKIWPLERGLKPSHVFAGSLLGCAELIRSGTTAFADMYFFMDESARAVEKAGLRANLSYGMIDLGNAEKRERELKEGERFARAWKGKAGGRIQTSLGPHAPYSCSKELLERAAELADKLDVRLQIHLSETRKEVFDLMKKTGKRPPAYLDSLGLLSPRVIAAHCCWLTKQEAKLLAQRGVSVSHCPVSNMKLAGGGVTPVAELVASGANLSLGTDGACSNNSLSMLETMKFAALLHKFARWDATVAGAQEVLDWATLGGAKALGINAGSIEKGRLADFVLLELRAPNLSPLHNPVSHVVYAANPSNITDVIVDGRPVLLERAIQSFDEEKAVEDAQKAAAELVG